MEMNKKGTRTRLTPEQSRHLKHIYHQTKHPDATLREKIAKNFNMSPRRVQIWFQNFRAKERRLNLPLKAKNASVEIPFLNSSTSTFTEYFKTT